MAEVRKAAEQIEQIALVSRCNKEGILIVCTENSLNFPVASLVSFLKPLLDNIWLKRFITHVNKLLNALTKQRISMGMKKGYPDLFVPEFKLFIEMKRRDGGVVSRDQKAMHYKLEELGYKVFIAYGAREAWEEIQRLKKRLE